MNTCKTCKWWGKNQPERDPNDEFENVAMCHSPKVHFAKTKYRDDENYQGELAADGMTDDVLASDEAAVQDGSGYFAAFYPGPDFGCIHYEDLPEVTEAARAITDEFNEKLRESSLRKIWPGYKPLTPEAPQT